MDRVWIKDAFWDTPNKSVLNCISEQEEGNKKIRQVHKLTQTDPLYKECVDTLTIEHIDENTKKRNNRKLEERKKREELKKSKENLKKMEILFNYKLETFEEEIKLSQNRELKSKLRRRKIYSRSKPLSLKILDDYLNSE